MLLQKKLLVIRRYLSQAVSTSECCKIQPSGKRSLADERPDLDFDYLLDEHNFDSIKDNIEKRKGIGDIQKVHDIWSKIQEYSKKNVGFEDEYSKLWHNFYSQALKIPNRTHKDAPIGGDGINTTIGLYGQRREKDDLFIAEDLISGWRSAFYPRGASGSRAYAFIGAVANIEHALLSFAMETAIELRPDFTQVDVPDLVPLTSTEGCGMNPKSIGGRSLQYLIDQDPQTCLSGTAEMGIAHLLKNTTLGDGGPHWFLAKSRCYRPEISYSAAEAKLYRVHEFDKVEMFVVCNSQESDECLDQVVSIQKEIFNRLRLHYRLLDMASQELGPAAARKFDIEAWMPGRKYFGEVSSASNCLDYQSRRLGIKIRRPDGKVEYAHTCNGTAISSSRALIAVLETHQDKTRKGWICPEELRKYMPIQRAATIFMKQAPKFAYLLTNAAL